jgi:hypothetical protein
VSAGESSIPEALAILGSVLPVLLPFALIAAWRTRVHAVRWRECGTLGSRGVAEAGLLGFGIAVLYLAPGIITRPNQAPPYVIVYGVAAFAIGLLVGLVLQATGLLTLKLYGSARPSAR